ncbi:hypothetical protein R6Q59_007976 [Mikania micrantha]
MTRISVESAKTVLEVAEVAFKAVEFSHNHPLHYKSAHQQKYGDKNDGTEPLEVKEKELEALRLENQRLRELLEENLKLLQNISESPYLLEDCPSDLHTRIMDTVESPKFLSQLKTLHKDSIDGIPGIDLQVDEILINVGCEEPSLWIWVSDEMVNGNVEEKSGIDNENYVVISQEQVVDGIAHFMARCILLNPKAKNLTPEEMQKSKLVNLCLMHEMVCYCELFLFNETFSESQIISTFFSCCWFLFFHLGQFIDFIALTNTTRARIIFLKHKVLICFLIEYEITKNLNF